jgi:sialic acid synthase SpsE
MSDLQIHGRDIGPGHRCFLIAEVGLNHNGDVQLAKTIVEAAVAAGADAVKFQKRTVDTLAIGSVLDADDARFPAFGTTYRRIREHLEFDWDQYVEIKRYCDALGVLFFATPFDIDAADFLERLDVPAFKIASHSVTNLPFLRHVARFGKPIIMSSGMCTLEEFDDAVAAVREGGAPLALMHCVSSYPQPPEQSNLRMMDVLRARYGAPVGYSGHEIGYLPTLAAVARGADIVERHVTTDRALVGFDHKLSLEPDELTRMIADIRTVEQTLGTGEKAVSDVELVTRRKYHVSIVSARDIPAGAVIAEDMLTLKNPGTGLPARRLGEVVGRRAKTFIAHDTLLALEMLEG